MNAFSCPAPVLVIEDDRSIAQMVTRVLSRASWPVEAVGTAADAMLHISRNEYSAIVLDLMLPHGYGGDFLDILRKERPELLGRTIVMTASPGLLKNLRADDLAGTLIKPFDINHLTALLQKVAHA